MTQTQTAVRALRSLQALNSSASLRYRWILLDNSVRDVSFPFLSERNRIFARAAVALHRAAGANLSERCDNAARKLEGVCS